ncbi:MAG: peptidoglycan-binding protein [Alphaproteobacteria bacterium]|nr:peptidoglycan-binding protein [Alphaproteobacteria bacterium]
MFTLKGPIASNASTDLEDSAMIKMALTSLRYYDDTETGLSPYGDRQLFQAVKSFQKDNGLKVDGVINPDGPTQKEIKKKLWDTPQVAGAFKDFVKNYNDMREDRTRDGDKYFHCKANYEATQRGWAGKIIAQKLSNAREVYGQYIKGDPESDKKADQKANVYGRDAALSGQYHSAREACAIYRVKGINEKY